jgi:transposase-like protein
MNKEIALKEVIEREEFDFDKLKEDVVTGLKSGKPFLGKDGTLTPLLKRLIEASLEGEIEAHVTNTKDEANRRNGKNSKLVKSDSGTFELETPRDRNGTFEPEIVRKRQTILNATLDNKILSLYSAGMSYADVSSHLADIYGVEVSEATISAITNKLLPLVSEWRNRPLEAVYPVVFLDAMFFKMRDEGKVVTKALYNILGITQSGHKEILGFYMADCEGAHLWLGILNDLRARGVEDILIACVDGLTGFPKAIAASFPKTEIQLCVVHQIRNSIKYVASKDQKAFMVDLKTVYQADTKDLAETNLLKLEEKWGKKYPMVLKSWQSKWDNLSSYFKYSSEIRRMIYTTNPIEGFHRQVRKFTKSKGAFTSEGALFKLIYCACQKIREKWNMPIQNWALIISQLDIYFPGRLKVELSSDFGSDTLR